MAPAFDQARAPYDALFASCRFLPSRIGDIAAQRSRLLGGKARYRQAATRTGVPWWFIGTIHAVESGFSFARHLHNGDPLTARTVHVPSGRPAVWNPPSDWVSSAVDALHFQGFAGAEDWSLARTLYRLEGYNGWGYRRSTIAINSPYLWSFSTHYKAGKFVADGRYDPKAISKQCGAACLLKALQQASDISF
ncbi:MAG: hypothetical protein ACKVOB_10125 [Sphingomonas sp.]